MNYYIQGDAANADRIKAAFEKKGVIQLNGWTCSGKDYIFLSKGSELTAIQYDEDAIYILETHPDYKELELQVAPKFKVGDWIINRFRDICLITDIDLENGYYICETNRFGNTDGDIDLTDKAFHLWTIQDAKDGDVLAADMIKSHPSPFVAICKKQDGELFETYCFIGYDGKFYKGETGHVGEYVHPATKEQRDLLFAKMREEGYQWDADKKELRKIKPHYDIANFYAGMPVLVREYDTCCWQWVLYSHFNGVGLFFAAGKTWRQCIPFNDDTKHLLGTTDPCDKQYINW